MPRKGAKGGPDHWEVCDACQLYVPLQGGNDSAACRCGATVARSTSGEQAEHWIQCDACEKWRAVSPEVLAAFQAAGGEWRCEQQFEGASCALDDDWQAGSRKSWRRQRAEREAAAEAAAARQADDALRRKRQWRAAQRSAGVSAAERYSEAAGEALGVLAAVGIDPGELREDGYGDAAYKPNGGGGGGGGGGKRRQYASGAEEGVGLEEGRDVWESCEGCGQWVNLGAVPSQQGDAPGTSGGGTQAGGGAEGQFEGQSEVVQPGRSAACPDCGVVVRWRGHADTQGWVQCDDCGRWRSVAQEVLSELEAGGPEARWVCSGMRPGVTCRTSANDWGRVVRAQAAKAARQALGAARLAISDRHVISPVEPAVREEKQQHERQAEEGGAPGGAAPAVAHWVLHTLPPSNFVEFIPGRDTLLTARELAAGLDAYDAGSGEHVLAVAAVPRETLALAAPAVLRGLALFSEGALPELIDGRASAGPVDLAAFLAQPGVGEAVKQALHRRRERRGREGLAAQRDPAALPHVVHVSAPDQRKVYVGEEGDLTKKGGSIMNFMKSWKSLPIRSWSGGVKMSDQPGSRPNTLVRSKLSALLADEEPALAAAAEAVFAMLAAHPATSATAQRMLAHLDADPMRAASRLGSSGFNAYSFNIDYQTGKHLDAKNVPGSYSALLIFETGAPFCGCHYLLPQYRMALDLRQGLILFHRSGDAEVGLHANSGLWCPDPASHRVALVLYQTELKAPSARGAGQAAAAEDEGEDDAGGEGQGGDGEGSEGAGREEAGRPGASTADSDGGGDPAL